MIRACFAEKKHIGIPFESQCKRGKGDGKSLEKMKMGRRITLVETGVVKVLKVAAAHDVGRAINPVGCE